MRNLIVFPAMVRTDQTQHCLEIRPILFKRVFRRGRCLSRCFVEKSLETLTIVHARFCIGERPCKRFAAKGGLAVRAWSLNIFSSRPSFGLASRFRFYVFHWCYESRSLRR